MTAPRTIRRSPPAVVTGVADADEQHRAPPSLLAATALVCILLVPPSTATNGRVAGVVEQGLYVLALLLDVIALRLLFTTPTARTDRCASTRPQAHSPVVQSDRSATATRSARRPGTRVCAGRMT
jgi:hypothetical protein